MDKNTYTVFSRGIIIVFVAFLILGFVSFGLFGVLNKNSGSNTILDIEIWGTLDKSTINPLIEKLKDKQRGYNKIVYIQKNKQVIVNEYIVAVASKKPPALILASSDIIFQLEPFFQKIPYNLFPRYLFEEQFLPIGHIFLRDDGILAFPFIIDPFVLFYNENIRLRNGLTSLPIDWNDLSNYSKVIKKNRTIINTALIPLGANNNYEHSQVLFTLLLKQVKNLNRGDRTIQQEDLLNTLKFYSNFINLNSELYTWNQTISSAKDLFLLDNLFIYPGFASEYVKLKKRNPNIFIKVQKMLQIEGTRSPINIAKLYSFGVTENNNSQIAYNALIDILRVLNNDPKTLLEIINLPPAIKAFNPPLDITSSEKNILEVGQFSSVLKMDNKFIDTVLVNLIKNLSTIDIITFDILKSKLYADL